MQITSLGLAQSNASLWLLSVKVKRQEPLLNSVLVLSQQYVNLQLLSAHTLHGSNLRFGQNPQNVVHILRKIKTIQTNER